MASTITEWLCAVAFCVYILTFTEEFRDVRVTHPKVCKNVRNISYSFVIYRSNSSIILQIR